MRTIAIPAKTGSSGGLRCRTPTTPPSVAPRPRHVIWIPPLEPFNPFEDASDDLIDELVDHLEDS